MSTAGFVVSFIAGLAMWTAVVADLSDNDRKHLRAKSMALLIGICCGTLAAGALALLSETIENKSLGWGQWPLGVLVCLFEYLRRAWRFEKDNPPPAE